MASEIREHLWDGIVAACQQGDWTTCRRLARELSHRLEWDRMPDGATADGWDMAGLRHCLDSLRMVGLD